MVRFKWGLLHEEHTNTIFSHCIEAMTQAQALCNSTPHSMGLKMILMQYVQLIQGHQLLDIELPLLKDFPNAQENLFSLLSLSAFKELERVKGVRSTFELSLSKRNIIEPIPMPTFENFQPIDKRISGGAQKKASGSGFYTTGNDKYFLKRVTDASRIADDLAEGLAFEIARLSGYDGFVSCFPVISNNGEVFVASLCKPKFKSIFNTAGRMTTRMTQSEMDGLLKTLNRQETIELCNILLMSCLIGDYDPNPGNLGKTEEGLIKIDHGWALDQLCAKFFPTWHNTLNPFRYPGRLAPTNAIFDYKEMFETPFSYDVIIQAVSILKDVENSKTFFEERINKILCIYQDSLAPDSLLGHYNNNFVMQALCERLGIKPTYSVKEIARCMSQALYNRSINLLIICCLQNIKLSSRLGNDFKILQDAYSQIQNIPLMNKPVLHDLCSEILVRSLNFSQEDRELINALYEQSKPVVQNPKKRGAQTPLHSAFSPSSPLFNPPTGSEIVQMAGGTKGFREVVVNRVRNVVGQTFMNFVQPNPPNTEMTDAEAAGLGIHTTSTADTDMTEPANHGIDTTPTSAPILSSRGSVKRRREDELPNNMDNNMNNENEEDDTGEGVAQKPRL